jgi:predicted aconitase/predicted aconitase with swiveling domain
MPSLDNMNEPSISDPHCKVVYGTPHVHGTASGCLLASSLELSFWGGVDHETGHVIDRSHPLAGQCLKDKILAIPGGRGSCSGSATILELIMNGNGPRALVFERTNEILAVGVFVAEEVFGKKIPMVVVGPENFRTVLGWNGEEVFIRDHRVSTQPLEESMNNLYIGFGAEHLQRHMPELSEKDRAMRSANVDDKSTYTKAQGLAMDIIIRTASIMKAPSLMSVSQAHVDGAHFGPASVLFGKQLRNLGGKFAVPTTVNAITVDQQRWRDLGVDTAFGTESDELAKAFLEMGAQMSFTCAPYQLDSAPKLGDQVAFGESNVVCYANSVLGARTAKYPNMLEALIALTGRAPRAGMHIASHRVPQIAITAPPHLHSRTVDDSFWPLLGYAIGAKAGPLIPLITGLDRTSTAQQPSRDALKAFSAAFATSAGAPMFHILGITPEAAQHSALASTLPTTHVTWQDLKRTWTGFNGAAPVPRSVHLVSLGNPHFSLLELATLARLVKGRTKHPSTSMIVTTSRAQHALAIQAGYVVQLDNFGVQVLTDTCWCFVRDPVIERAVECIMTNSGKYAHYGPGLTGREFRFGSLGECVESACSGVWDVKMPLWLEDGVWRS